MANRALGTNVMNSHKTRKIEWLLLILQLLAKGKSGQWSIYNKLEASTGKSNHQMAWM